MAGVIGLLAPLAVLGFLGAKRTSEGTACLENRKVIEGIEQRFKIDTGRHSTTLYELVDAGYVKWNGLCPANGVYAWVPYSENDSRYHSILGCSTHGASSIEETSSGVMDNFDDLNADGWTEIGNWEVNAQGQYVSYADRTRRGEQRAYFGDQDLADYDVSVKATLQAGSQSLGLYFRMTYEENDPRKTNGYAFLFDPGQAARNLDWGAFYFSEVRNGRHRLQRQTTTWRTASKNWKWFEQEHELRVSVRGNTFVGYVDGQEVARYTDTKKPSTQGAAGLRVVKGSGTFDDFSITFP